LDTTRHDDDEDDDEYDVDEQLHGSTPDLYTTPYFKETAGRESNRKIIERISTSKKASNRGLYEFFSSEHQRCPRTKRGLSSGRSCASMPCISSSSKLAPAKSIDDIIYAYERIVKDNTVEPELFGPTGWE
jgi:hypothetical protein